MTTRPELCRSRPPRIIIRVVFPEPDGPTSPTDSPAAIASDTPRKTLTGPAALPSVRWMSSTRTSGWDKAADMRSLRERRRRKGGYGPLVMLVNCVLAILLSLGTAAEAAPARILALGDSIT